MQRKGFGGKRSCFCHNFVSSTSAKLTERKKPQLFFNFKVEAVESPPGREARTATALEE